MDKIIDYFNRAPQAQEVFEAGGRLFTSGGSAQSAQLGKVTKYERSKVFATIKPPQEDSQEGTELSQENSKGNTELSKEDLKGGTELSQEDSKGGTKPPQDELKEDPQGGTELSKEDLKGGTDSKQTSKTVKNK